MSIRIRTGYSFRSAVGRIDDVISRLVECGQSYAPITDTASTFGYVKWRKAAIAAGLQPVFGVELAVTTSINEKKPSVDYWTFIAKDSLIAIHELISLATNQFRYQPLLTRVQALERDDLYIIMGYRAKFEEIEPKENLFFALAPSLTKGQFNRAINKGHQPVAASDNRYPREGGQGLYETICGRLASTQSYPQWIMTENEWIEDCEDRFGSTYIDAAIMNFHEIAENSTANLAHAEMVRPEREASLEVLCHMGAMEAGCSLTDKRYAERLKRELDLITEKNFEDYFYLVADACRFARTRMIVGPGRGSSCGSLVCYLLRITTIDPIKYGLMFERFIDINRNDMPDIDVDFPEDRRNEVFEYIAKKYGENRVARLGTVSMYQARSALREAAGALAIEPWHVAPVGETILKNTLSEALKQPTGQQFLEKYPEMKIVMEMEGHPRHAGQHAAGIVITDRPVMDYVAIDQRTGAAMCDKKDAEELNLLKIDALGLTQLSVFEEALQLAGLDRNKLFDLPLDDKKAFDILNSKRFAGIFQFNGIALQSIVEKVEIKNLNDIAAINALSRPGPLASGQATKWIEIKQGKVKVTYPHQLFKPFLQDTLGVVVYQEQVMKICREIGDMSWEDVTAIRKAMSRSLGAEFFNQYGEKWKAGARKKKIPDDVLDKVWTEMCAFGAWAFNLSHALAYAIVSYYCCWLKVYYPLQFAAATLTYTKSPDMQIKLLRELASEGVEYVPVDLDKSTHKWAVVDNKLIGPLTNIIGCGPKMQGAILSRRESINNRNMLNEDENERKQNERAEKFIEKARTNIDSLYPVRDSINKIMPNPKEKGFISTPMPINQVQCNGAEFEAVVFCTIDEIKPKNENDPALVAKRGGKKVEGQTNFLNLRLADDTDTIFAKVPRWDFERLGKPIIDRGRVGKALYAIKGNVPRNFRMINIKNVKYIGDMEKDI
jgi:DNA polymerase III alpha subunit